MAAVSGKCLADWLKRWVAILLQHRNLCADADGYLITQLRKSGTTIPADMHRKTGRELERILAQARLDDGGIGPDRLCRWILAHRAAGRSLTANELVCKQMSWIELNADGIANAWRQLLGILPHDSGPTMLVLADGTAEQRESLQERRDQIELLSLQAETLAGLAVRVPRLTIGLAVDEQEWKGYVARTPESFSKAVIGEHLILVRGLTADRIRQIVASKVGGHIGTLEPICDHLAKIGASEELAERLAEATAASPTRPAKPTDPWKSEQERFLFELLDHTADLSGLFQLNVDPGFMFGGKRAEVDLACLDLKIAIEIDGYHHFTDPDHYRRDRRKDLELQQHGYFVLRWLAEDVVPQMATVLGTVRAVVRSRTSHSHT
ncbi:MAG: endonuclease domain-containing protein [Pirellulaceae bacterium]